MSEQEEREVAQMPFYVHEIEMTRAETVIKRLTWIAAIGWAVTVIAVVTVLVR